MKELFALLTATAGSLVHQDTILSLQFPTGQFSVILKTNK